MGDLMARLHAWDSWAEWVPSNNDDPPTGPDEGDYAPWWDNEREWIEPHPDMWGLRCSTGFAHMPYRAAWRDPVGLANLPARVMDEIPEWIEWLEEDDV